MSPPLEKILPTPMFVAMLFLNFDGALVGFETRALVPKRRDLA